MVLPMQKNQIINLKRQGLSNREVARRTGFDRGTVAKYWNEAKQKLHELELKDADERTIQEEIYAAPQYKKRAGRPRKFNEEMQDALKQILEQEESKKRQLGWDKQKLSNIQIRERLLEEGYEIGQGVVNIYIARFRAKERQPQAYIRQEYELGERLEYDFGEVKLDVGNGYQKYQMAVFCAPASNFRWAYLYDNQKQAVFLDSHVQFFDMCGGAWQEVVYDNMKNVVTKFIGKHEKQINSELLNLASYYGFNINVTNCFSGNEKGSVERSVDVIRNKIFALQDKFDCLDKAIEYMNSRLLKINEKSGFDEEKEYLLKGQPKYELAQLREAVVSKYAFISVEGVKYSVPEVLVSKRVSVKLYHDEIRVYSNFIEVAQHKREFEKGKYVVNIMHFLKTLHKKPGAVKNSAALKAIPTLKNIFDKHFKENPRKFIEIFIEHEDKSIEEIIAVFQRVVANRVEIKAMNVVKAKSRVEEKMADILETYTLLSKGGDF